MTRALMLDLDGTIADSLGGLRDAFFRFISLHSGAADSATFERFNGPAMIEIISVLRTELQLAASVADLLAEYNAMIDETYEGVLPVDGATEMMEAAYLSRWRIAVVTSNNAIRTRRWLEHSGLIRFCTTAVCDGEVPRGKPHPDPYLEALRRLGVDACEACAVEDSTWGALAAIGAGLRTFVHQPPNSAERSWPPGVVPFARFSELQQKLFVSQKPP